MAGAPAMRSGALAGKEAWLTVALAALKLVVSLWVLHVGFTHVSDDDYARVTIAEAFAHTPRLDPSGTSWLPFPFWLNGGVMLLFGRSLPVARAVAVASGILGAVIAYGAARALDVRREVAWTGVAVAMCAPWSAWLGVATVPEALTASLMAAAAMCVAAPRARVLGAASLLVATLSRYEAWPVAAVFVAACLWSVRRGAAGARERRARDLGAAGMATVGPAAWLIWNWHAHGNPLQFLARVAAYRARVAPTATGSWSLYPEAFAHAGPGTLALLVLAAPALILDRSLRQRWAGVLAAMLAMFAFLVEGDLHDGAPTHHPERALVALFWLGTLLGFDALAGLVQRHVRGRRKREAWCVGLLGLVVSARALAWPADVARYPARAADENRAAVVAQGDDLRGRGVDHVTVTPCAYEHFALIAAFGAPERVTVLPQAPRGSPCPVVTED